jgi:hypothetical protein
VAQYFHIKVKCAAYENLRLKYLPTKYFVNPNIHKFNILMSCQAENFIDNLSKFVSHAIEERFLFKHNFTCTILYSTIILLYVNVLICIFRFGLEALNQ